MTIAVFPPQSDIEKGLWLFLTAVLPAGTEIVKGQINRVPQPRPANHVVFWPIRKPRLSTNVDNYADVLFTGSIAAAVLTVSAITFGTVGLGATLFGSGVAADTLISAQTSGPAGGIGTYTVSVAQTLGSRLLAAGQKSMLQATENVFQVEVHGPASADNAQIIATMLRDEYAVLKFAETGFATPLYCDDPREIPFLTGEQQYSARWIIDVRLQANQAILVPQQFADAVDVDLVLVP